MGRKGEVEGEMLRCEWVFLKTAFRFKMQKEMI